MCGKAAAGLRLQYTSASESVFSSPLIGWVTPVSPLTVIAASPRNFLPEGSPVLFFAEPGASSADLRTTAVAECVCTPLEPASPAVPASPPLVPASPPLALLPPPFLASFGANFVSAIPPPGPAALCPRCSARLFRMGVSSIIRWSAIFFTTAGCIPNTFEISWMRRSQYFWYLSRASAWTFWLRPPTRS